MILAKQIQDLIGAKAYENIAHGYTLDRNTLDVYFNGDGFLVREESEYDGEVIKSVTSPYFDASFFFKDVKRWYDKKTNKKLKEWFEAFGNSLSTTP